MAHDDAEAATTQARELLDAREFRQLLEVVKLAPQTLELVQLAAEAHLEISALPDGDLAHAQQAYSLFQTAAKLDPDGSKGGFEKFLWLGQLSGGREADKWFRKGCQVLRHALAQGPSRVLTHKLCEALCSLIEVWMTDLCMEDEAEQVCDALIAEAMMVDSDNPDNYSSLASIRISQQRPDEAVTAVTTAWQLFLAHDLGDEIAQINFLKTIAKLAIELAVFEIAEAACTRIIQLDDQIAEAYYLAGLAYMQHRPTTHLQNAYDAFSTALELATEDEMLEDLPVLISQVEDLLKTAGASEPVEDDDEWLDVLDD